MKVEKAVRSETARVAIVTGILSVLMQSVFLVVGKWDTTVLFGNLLGAAAAILNFFLMGLTVQSAVDKEPDKAALQMKTSQMLRLLMMFLFGLFGSLAPWFHVLAVLIPFFFPRAAIMLHKATLKRGGKAANESRGDDVAPE